MSYGHAIDHAFFLLGSGTLLLYFALIRPRWLDYIPGLTWFNGLYRVRRFGAIVGALTCILAGAWELGVIAAELQGLLVVSWTTVVVIAALHDAGRETRTDT